MIGLVIHVAALVLLVACWLVGDLEFRTKVVLTVVYLVTWAFVFVSAWVTVGAQAFLIVILWYATFGPAGRR
jgi:hypothetical protein